MDMLVLYLEEYLQLDVFVPNLVVGEPEVDLG